MKKVMLITLILTFVSVSVAQDPGWPRQKASPAGRLVYYQPQSIVGTITATFNFAWPFHLHRQVASRLWASFR
jgi:hypothetical protein